MNEPKFENKVNFLGIAGVRCGSTWLHDLLNSHPEISMPEHKKELYYFTRHFDKGDKWYNSQFKKKRNVRFTGEITPGYLCNEIALQRIIKYPNINKFVLILRDPIERCYSHYKWHLRVTGDDISFNYFYKNFEIATEHGFYGKHLSRFLKHYDKEKFLILTYEKDLMNPESAIKKISDFFSIKEDDFIIPGKTNEGIIPKYQKIFLLLRKVSLFFRRNDLNRLSNFFIKIGVKKLFNHKKTKLLYTMSEADIDYLKKIYKPDFQILLKNFPDAKNFRWRVSETKS